MEICARAMLDMAASTPTMRAVERKRVAKVFMQNHLSGTVMCACRARTFGQSLQCTLPSLCTFARGGAERPGMIGHLAGLLIQWSVKVEFCKGDTILGMWQVVQFLVLTGQAAPG